MCFPALNLLLCSLLNTDAHKSRLVSFFIVSYFIVVSFVSFIPVATLGCHSMLLQEDEARFFGSWAPLGLFLSLSNSIFLYISLYISLYLSLYLSLFYVKVLSVTYPQMPYRSFFPFFSLLILDFLYFLVLFFVCWLLGCLWAQIYHMTHANGAYESYSLGFAGVGRQVAEGLLLFHRLNSCPPCAS